MARPISDEELQLKQRARRRLVGAIVLATAAAVILPMVLDSEPKPLSQNVDIQIPSPDSGEFKPKSSPSASSAAARPAPPEQSKSAPPSRPQAAPAPVTDIAGPVPPTTAAEKPDTGEAPSTPAARASKDSAKSASKEAARDKENATASAGTYAVQVAALADARKVKELEKQMAGAGLKTYTEVVNTQAGEVTRVRAGPYASREAAEKARAQLKQAGLDGKIVQK
jgi:DedD protein